MGNHEIGYLDRKTSDLYGELKKAGAVVLEKNYEDLFIPREQFQKMDEFLRNEGFMRDELIEDKDYQEVPYKNLSNGLYLELHMEAFAMNVLDDMLDGGIFGQNDMNRVHSANITLNAAEKSSIQIGMERVKLLEKYKIVDK